MVCRHTSASVAQFLVLSAAFWCVPDVLIAQGSVSGRITDTISGEGVGGASVHLFSRGVNRNSGGGQSSTVTSLDDGSFRLERLAAGTYVLLASHPNYVMSFNRSETISVSEGQQITGVSIGLNPLGTLSGKVLGENLRPVGGIVVELFSVFNQFGAQQLRRVQSTSSNARGEYTLNRVAPGKYYVAAGTPVEQRPRKRFAVDDLRTHEPVPQTKPPASKRTAEGVELNYVRTFAPKAINLESAGLLEVAPGAKNADIDIQLQRAETFTVRGRIESSAPGALQHGASLRLTPRGTNAMSGLGRTMLAKEDGSFAIDRVPSGSYTLWLMGSYGNGGESNRRASRNRVLGRQEVDVNASDVNEVLLSLLPPINLTGHVVLVNAPSGTANLPQIVVILQPAGPGAVGSFVRTAVDASGAFSLQDFEPGQYMVRVTNVPSGMFVQSVDLNRQDVRTGGMDLSQGGGGELQITLRNGAAEVDGSLATGNGTNQGTTGTVLLVPEILPADGSGVLTGSLAAGGTFSVKSVRPGHYSAFAVEHWTSIWQNTDFLRAMQREGVPVEAQENGHVQVQIPLLTMARLQAEAARLGLSVQ